MTKTPIRKLLLDNPRVIVPHGKRGRVLEVAWHDVVGWRALVALDGSGTTIWYEAASLAIAVTDD